MSSDATLIEERQLARSTPVHAIRLAIIVQLILVFSVLVYSLESEEKLDKMLKEDLVRGAIQKPIVNEMDFKQHIESLVDEMHASHANFLLGVDEVLLVKEDLKFSNDSNNCETPHVLGALAGDDIIIKDSGKELNAHIFYHEVGHNVYKQISNDQKKEWEDMYRSERGFVSRYASLSVKEYFAENFGCYFFDFEGCKKRMNSDAISAMQALVN